MIEALNKYESLSSVIGRCNDVVLEVLAAGAIREARIAAESFRNGGKRLRPALMILSSMASNGSTTKEVPTSLVELAGAVELVHLATLFHDDVIDEVETRRAKLSARAKYGNYISVLAGDYVLAEALLLVNRSGLHHTLPEFLRTIRVLVRGESRETNHKYDFDMNDAAYYEIISEKSASLFSLSCKVGGMSHGSDYTDVLGHFGWNLGMAFQMIDDLDDMLELPAGNADCDLKNGYIALPVIHVLGSVRDGHRESLVELIRGGAFTTEDEMEIAFLCARHGGIQHAHEEIRRHLDRAREYVEPLRDGDAKALLGAIVSDLGSYADAQVAEYLRLASARTSPAASGPHGLRRTAQAE